MHVLRPESNLIGIAPIVLHIRVQASYGFWRAKAAKARGLHSSAELRKVYEL